MTIISSNIYLNLKRDKVTSIICILFFVVVVVVDVRLSFVLTSNSRSICKCYQSYLRMNLVDDLIHCIFHYFEILVIAFY